MKEVKNYPLFWLSTIAVLAFVLGWLLGHRDYQVQIKNYVPRIEVANREPPKNLNVDFALFWNVWNELPQKFIDKSQLDPQKLLYGAISGMVRSVGDPYTTFLNPEQNRAITEELAGQYEGVGIQLGFNKDKQLVVITPLKGTPAEKAGVRPRDLILQIGDKDTFNMTLPEAVTLIRGKAGSKIKLSLRHDGEDNNFQLELERARITIKSVEVEYKDSIAIIKLSRFSQNTQGEWDKTVSEILQKGAKGIVLDVRNDPGGYLSGAVYVASEFVSGDIVKQEGASGQAQVFKSQREGKLLREPLVVLINGGSASSSEIVAGAVAAKRRGRLVGENSFGKGSVQEVSSFEGGSALHVTTSRWLLPNGKGINSEGLKPDVLVKLTPEDREAGRDPQLDRAIEILKGLI